MKKNENADPLNPMNKEGDKTGNRVITNFNEKDLEKVFVKVKYNKIYLIYSNYLQPIIPRKKEVARAKTQAKLLREVTAEDQKDSKPFFTNKIEFKASEGDERTSCGSSTNDTPIKLGHPVDFAKFYKEVLSRATKIEAKEEKSVHAQELLEDEDNHPETIKLPSEDGKGNTENEATADNKHEPMEDDEPVQVLPKRRGAANLVSYLID